MWRKLSGGLSPTIDSIEGQRHPPVAAFGRLFTGWGFGFTEEALQKGVSDILVLMDGEQHKQAWHNQGVTKIAAAPFYTGWSC